MKLIFGFISGLIFGTTITIIGWQKTITTIIELIKEIIKNIK